MNQQIAQTNEQIKGVQAQLQSVIKQYDLIEKDGELKSQQYRTDIGPIDILAREKNTNNYVVIELKRNQTSDSTVGQIARYMGWVEEHLQ